jgi:hypothetical protein
MYPTIFFPAVSNGERVGKLSVVVEGTFLRMRDFLLPRWMRLSLPDSEVV